MDYDVVMSLRESVTGLWFETLQVLPQIVIAVLVLILGWIIGGILARVVRRLFTTLHLDTALDKAGVDQLSERAGVAFQPAHFAGSLVKWFIILAFSIVAFDILGLTEVTEFVRDVVLGYLPQIFVAVLILFAAMIIGQVAQSSLEAALRASGTQNPHFFGKIAYVLVIGFAVMAALNQLSIANELIETLFMGIVFALSLALGLAFGLGGKDAAKRYLEHLTKTTDCTEQK